MRKPTVEQRLEALEAQVAKLASAMGTQPVPRAKDWRRTIGIFTGSGMKEVFDEAQKLRHADREKFFRAEEQRKQRRKARKTSRAKS